MSDVVHHVQGIEREALGSGGPRSAQTRRAILDAARASFAVRGYERTTIRAVAASAKIDPAMVIRYFESKAGLFTAAAALDFRAPDLAGVEPDERGEFLVRHFLARWEEDVSNDTLGLLVRTAVTHDDVARQLEGIFHDLVRDPLAALDASHVEVRAALVSSQLLGLALGRYILHFEPLASMSVEDVVASLAPTIQGYLDASLKN